MTKKNKFPQRHPTMERPLKRFSQNFLTNPYYQNKIVEAMQIKPGDFLLEIGPGRGALCPEIIKARPEKYLAVEIDRSLTALLKKQFEENIQIIEGDFLELDLGPLFLNEQNDIKIIGNIPYNITSPIIFKLLDYYNKIQSVVLMAQKEVARRITAEPGNKDYGILSVLCQTYSLAEYLFEVKRGNFFPAPNVDSAVFRLNFFSNIESINNEALFRRIVRHTFNYRRKMLRNSLGRIFSKTIVYSLDSVNLESRPENLTIQDFKNLANEIDKKIQADK